MDRAFCGDCGQDLVASGVDVDAEPRVPCPDCGSSLRRYTASIRAGIKMGGHARALGFRDTALRFITESARGGLASSAEVSGGGIRQELRGQPIQGEDDTESACRRLLAVMNASGADWAEPEEGSADEDCVAEERGGGEELRIQVVRAVAEPGFWRALAREGKLREDVLAEAAAGRLREAIEHKKGIPAARRAALVLALDAGRVPALAFEEVAVSFKKVHDEWAASLGFAEVWVVGPDRRLVHRLA